MKYLITTVLLIITLIGVKANNLEITNLTSTGNQVTFDLSWDNSWHNTLEHHDAAWVFVKQAPNGGASWLHANILSATVSSGYQVVVSVDNVGVTFRRSGNGNGTVNMSVTLTLDNPMGIYRDYKVMGTEMVYVPEGSFYVGDGWSFHTYHQGDDPTLSYHVTSEGAITHGTTIDDIGGGNYGGADINAEFPKGYSAFYCMKYQITMSQYVDFLNCQSRASQDSLTNSDLSGSTITNTFVMTDTDIEDGGNPIRCDSYMGYGNIEFYCDLDEDFIKNEYDDGQSRAINNMNVGHLLAYLDWAGLAPMTDFEYEKACRGPVPAVTGEYAWGSTLINYQSVVIDDGEITEKTNNSGNIGGLTLSNTHFANETIRVGCHAPTTGGSRELSNATYYGISGMSQFNNTVIQYIYQDPYLGQSGDGTIANGKQNSFGLISNMRRKDNARTSFAGTNQSRISSLGMTVFDGSITSGRGIRRL